MPAAFAVDSVSSGGTTAEGFRGYDAALLSQGSTEDDADAARESCSAPLKALVRCAFIAAEYSELVEGRRPCSMGEAPFCLGDV